MKRFTRIVSLALAISLAITGCGSDSAASGEREIKVKLNETIDADSKWINSNIEGAINADTPVNLKDDFYTYASKDWILENVSKIDETHSEISMFTEGIDVINARLKSIISGTESPDETMNNAVGYNEEDIEHDLELVMAFTGTAGDWEKRNALGIKPLIPYLEKIDSISTIDEMSSYMASLYTSNYTALQLVQIGNSLTYGDHANNHVVVEPFSDFILAGSSDGYYKANLGTRLTAEMVKSIVSKILNKAGYSDKDADRMLRNCYKFEGMLSDAQRGISDDDYTKEETYYSMDEIKALFGNYPIEELLKAYGYVNSEGYIVYFPQNAKKISSLYKASNLKLIKDFYAVHTVMEMATLLDRESYELYTSAGMDDAKEVDEGDTRENTSDDKELDILLNDFTYVYMTEPLDAVYVSRYCTPEQKEELTDLVKKAIAVYVDMIDTEEWLSKEAREATKEKLNAMKLYILYPDEYPSYADVEFDEDDTLPEMIAKLNIHKQKQSAGEVGQPVVNGFDMSTTTMNAFYNPFNNSVNILAGITAPEHVYDPDDPIEVRLGGLGAIIGHEISHGFDDNGVKYDKDGNEETWWGIRDITAYTQRAVKLQNYYSALVPIRGGKQYSGSIVSGEAIADLGGIKCMLAIAKTIDDFDYDLFFRSYAYTWRDIGNYDAAKTRVQSDEHPLAFLRVNVVLQQYDEFYETYDIKPGDGMYIDTDKRINVW